MTVSELSKALDEIEKQKPAMVHASRKGICIGYHCPRKGTRKLGGGLTVIFRRDGTEITVEERFYPSKGSQTIVRSPLPAKLVERCARLLDR